MTESHISNTMTDYESSKNIAHRIFQIYDIENKGYLDDNEIGNMMCDTYKSINKHFDPSEYDISTMKKTIDSDKDGRVTIKDVEKMVIKLMCNENY